MTLLLLLSKMFLSFSVSQYFTFSILYNVLCTYLSLHAHCHCNVCIAACVANKLLHYWKWTLDDAEHLASLRHCIRRSSTL